MCVRLFNRADREQLTGLVNAHLGALFPGLHLSTSQLLSHLEREPDEFVVDGWVAERHTLVATRQERVLAAAHLVRYHDGLHVAPGLRGSAELRWLFFIPPAPGRADSTECAEALLRSCLRLMNGWRPRRILATGSLPVPIAYGIPAEWPHLHDLLTGHDFRPTREPELVLIARVADLAAPAPGSHRGWSIRRRVGANGTRLAVVDDHGEVGSAEVAVRSPLGQRFGDGVGLADLGEFEDGGDDALARYLLAAAADWLGMGGVHSLLGYESEQTVQTWLARGFSRLTTINRPYLLSDSHS